MSITDLPAVATVHPARCVRGQLLLPGDKSISHRYAMLAALADGQTHIRGYSTGADCRSTLQCLRALGVSVEIFEDDRPAIPNGATGLRIEIAGRGLRGLARAAAPLDAGNSGTTLRLLTGILAAHPFESVLTGDESLRRRPMRRIIEPLTRMGASVTGPGDRPPLTVRGATLHPIEYTPPIPSAQVKSAILLAGIQTDGGVLLREPVATRDHTEVALRAFGVRVREEAHDIAVGGGERLEAQDLSVPGDFSSGAVWAVAAAALPGSTVELSGIGLNPTRTALLAVLERVGTRVEVTLDATAAGEPSGRVRVAHRAVEPITIGPDEVPGLIDELPLLAAMATHGGDVRVTGAGELRGKESDRITALVTGLRALGADADEFADGFHVRGTKRLRGGRADATGDHRLAMAFTLAALGAKEPSQIVGAEVVGISYPRFFETLASIVV